jgi:hypothetical protein
VLNRRCGRHHHDREQNETASGPLRDGCHAVDP